MTQTTKTVHVDALANRSDVLAAMQRVMGSFPATERRCPLDVTVQEQIDCGSYVRQLITYASEPGSTTPAYLLIPKTAIDLFG